MKFLNEISKKIRRKIYELQNPPTEKCSNGSMIVCRLNIDAGLASVFHDILWCLLYSYYRNKTLLLFNVRSFYFRGDKDEDNKEFEPWESFMKPLSSTCDQKKFSNETLEVVPMENGVFVRKMAADLPKEFGSEIIKLVDSPMSWFHSHFMGYILRPQKRLIKHLQDFKKSLNFRHPIVGVHVRRTDKLIREAAFHANSEYMIHVKDFYDKLALKQKVDHRLVYIASDDPIVMSQLKVDYPDYEFIGNPEGSKLAENQNTRYGNNSLWGALTDIFLLSETDYIVCTFSSAVSLKIFLFCKFYGFPGLFHFKCGDSIPEVTSRQY
jgi:glycoprotein 6-alpha-L-fucosyltransferase